MADTNSHRPKVGFQVQSLTLLGPMLRAVRTYDEACYSRRKLELNFGEQMVVTLRRKVAARDVVSPCNAEMRGIRQRGSRFIGEERLERRIHPGY